MPKLVRHVAIETARAHCRNKTDTLFGVALAVTRSCLPSPLKSPTATD